MALAMKPIKNATATEARINPSRKLLFFFSDVVMARFGSGDHLGC